MTRAELDRCWVPLPVPWRLVENGDVVEARPDAHGKVTRLLPVVTNRPHGHRRLVTLAGYKDPFPVDPDEHVQVLTPVPMADAQTLPIDELGAVLIERRTTGGAAA